MTKATRPKAKQQNGSRRKLRYYCARLDKLTIEDGMLRLFNTIVINPNRPLCDIVPQQEKQEILDLKDV